MLYNNIDMSAPDHENNAVTPVMARDRILLMANQIGDFYTPSPPRGRRGLAQPSAQLLGPVHAS